MRLLGVLDLAGIDTRGIGQVLGTIKFLDMNARRGQRGLRQRRGVRTHIGDEAVFIQPLGDLHGARGAVAEFA